MITRARHVKHRSNTAQAPLKDGSNTAHTPHEAILRLSVRQLISTSAMVLAGVLSTSARAAAQSTTSLQTDATVLPRHRLGIRLLSGFTRFDELVGNGGTRNIAASFAVDSFGPNQLLGLATSQGLIRALSGNSAFNVTAGNIVAAANSRIVTAPLIVEYGLTSRITIGVVVPLVETRTTVFAQLNPQVGFANVGPNPAISSGDWTANAALVASFRAAATSLQTRLTQCQTTPSGSGCSTLLAQQSTVQSLIGTTGTFTSAIASLFGTGQDQPGAFFVPIGGTAAQIAIVTQIQNLAAQYQNLGATVSAGTVTAAGGPAARVAMQSLLAQAGYDSLQSTDRSSIGDITIGATYQLTNSLGDSTNTTGRGYRIAVHAAGRIGTGEPANRNRLFDNATGYGQPGVILGGAVDARLTPKYWLSAIGSYTKQLSSIAVSRPANAGNALLPLTALTPAAYSAGDVLSLTLLPRIRLAGLFSLDGYYTLDHAAADSYTFSGAVAPEAIAGGPTTPSGLASSTAQRVGFGFSYSSFMRDRNPGRLPYEASFRHIETLTATGGPVAKTSQDQIQLRVFFR
jgi:hypothetical protein